MDYECKQDKLAVGLRPVFKPLKRDDATNAFLMRSSKRPFAVNWGMAAACTYLRKFMVRLETPNNDTPYGPCNQSHTPEGDNPSRAYGRRVEDTS